jgi:hypothetical protein
MTRRKTSVVRGLTAAIPLAVVGYALPILAFRGFDAIRYGEHAFQNGFFADIINSHRRLTIHNLKMIGPNLGCMLLFGLSGFVNFTPKRFPGLLHTAIRIGVASVAGVLVMGIATAVFGLATQSYTSDPHAPTRFAIFVTVPLVYSAWILNCELHLTAQKCDEP